MSENNKITSVLFVCLGNICRSPTAEAVFRHRAKEAGLTCKIDSAGTIGYHAGNNPDVRSRQAGEARGYSFQGITSRQVTSEDLNNFDFILAMDESNLADLMEINRPESTASICLFLDFAQSTHKEVPDPYYGGEKGFELVLDLIESASDGLIQHIQKNVI